MNKHDIKDEIKKIIKEISLKEKKRPIQITEELTAMLNEAKK